MNKSLVIVNTRVLNLRVILEQFTHFFFRTEKGKTAAKMSDNYGHNIIEGELYFRGNYLQLVRSKKISNKQFKIIEKDVIISSEEVFETFIDVQEDLTMAVNYYLGLVGRAK